MKIHKLIFPFLSSLLIFFLKIDLLFSEERKIEIINETKDGRGQVIEQLSLIRLKGGMQVVKSLNKVGPTFNLQIPHDNSGFPYMLQGIHKGVKYNHVIPPNLPANESIKLKVYEKNNQYRDIQLRILYVVHYVGDSLRFLVLYKFANQSRYTFVEKKNGIYFIIPNGVKNVNASVSVGSALSNIQWLKIEPETIKNKKNTIMISYPMKPGERIYQIGYQLPYDGSLLSLPIQSIYPVANQIEILLETKDLNVGILEQPNWLPQKNMKEEATSLSGNLIVLPKFLNILNLTFQGGSPSKEENQATHSDSVLIQSPLNMLEKIIYPIVSIFIVLVSFVYISKKPMWLIRFWLKRKSLLEYQLSSIEGSNAPQYTALIQKIKKQLSILEKRLERN